MDWDDIREWADRPVDLPFEFHAKIRFDTPAPDSAALAALLLERLEAEFHEFSTRIGKTFLAGRNRIADITSERSDLVPWLSNSASRIPLRLSVHIGFITSAFDLRRPLAGQKFDGEAVAAEFAFRDSDAARGRPVQVLVDKIELAEGSLLASIKGRIRTTVLAGFALLTVIGGGLTYLGDLKGGVEAVAVVYEKGSSIEERRQFEHGVIESTKNQKCVVDLHWNVNFKALREQGEEALNYEAPGLSAGEYAARVCNAQLVLNTVVKSICIDGKVGPETRGAVQEYASYLNLPPKTTIADKLLRRKLWEEFLSLGKKRA